MKGEWISVMILPTVNMVVIWASAAIILFIVELIVPGLVSIWFALGAVAALVAAILHAPIWLQITWFAVVSVAALVLTRPLAKKYVNSRAQPTNADMLIGKECVVTEAINNLQGTGAVKINGKEWTARMADKDASAEEGSVLKVVKIEGVKLIVK